MAAVTEACRQLVANLEPWRQVSADLASLLFFCVEICLHIFSHQMVLFARPFFTVARAFLDKIPAGHGRHCQCPELGMECSYLGASEALAAPNAQHSGFNYGLG